MQQKTCLHNLGFLSTMETISVTSDFYLRKCTVCSDSEYLPRAGKIWTGYSIEAEQKRDFERRRYAKDMLQPKDKKGKTTEIFQNAWGDPYHKSEIGKDVDKYQIKDEKKV